MKHRVRNRGKGKRAEHELPLLPLWKSSSDARAPASRATSELAGWSAAPP